MLNSDRFRSIAVIVGAVTLLLPAHASAARLVVGFTPGASGQERREALAQLPVSVLDGIGPISAVTVEVPDHAAARVQSAIERRTAVRYVDADVTMRATWTPDDPRLGSQWGIQRIGAPTAWDTGRGSSVMIAIVDSGVDYTHPDLRGKVTLGRDFVSGDVDPMDEHGHGTHVAGIAAAATDNATGIAGAAPGATILAVRVLDANGSGYMSWVANGIVHAADEGARVINLSLGGSSGTTTLHDAVHYARSRGAVVTCAAGNDGNSSLSWPAAYAACTSVGATDASDARASFSNHGTGLDLVAPGVSILSAVPGGGYASWSGTSMATPFASGVAAMLIGRGLSGEQAEQALASTATDLGPGGYDTTFGHGLLSAAGALASTAVPGSSEPAPSEPAPPTEPAPVEPAPVDPEPANSAPTCGSSSVTASGATTITLRCSDGDGDPLTLAIVRRPSRGTVTAIDQATGRVTYTPAPKASGRDSFSFRANDGATTSDRATVTISLKPRYRTKTTCTTQHGTRSCTTWRAVYRRDPRTGRTSVRWVRVAPAPSRR